MTSAPPRSGTGPPGRWPTRARVGTTGLDIRGYTWWPFFDFVDWSYASGGVKVEEFEISPEVLAARQAAFANLDRMAKTLFLSFEMTGRLGSTARVASASARGSACCAGFVATSWAPQPSLSGTHVTTLGWWRCCRTASSQLRHEPLHGLRRERVGARHLRPQQHAHGWEHQCSDILGVHDYEGDGRVLAGTYGGDDARARLLTGAGPAGRRLLIGAAQDEGQPLMLTEFGGIDVPTGAAANGWGYTSARDEDDWVGRIAALYDAVRSSPVLAGSCYTQLTDTAQETNGLCTADRRPKAPVARIRRAVTGREDPVG